MNQVDRDYALALQLQEQFDKNERRNVVTPVKSVPTQPGQTNQGKPSLGSLGSPTWELSDPTPNVHALFLQFNKTFFWGKLASVVVRWSKRMYSCAGICRYEGRGGFCDIALSEPLLKLRPRKDLIETLLHEMIHAYLFLTDRDRDRDGHGPNFQQHMHRLNKACNINISIYHDFHDEVRLYKTHWWRCNGHCQKQKPFFGMVRRSSNRAPGPNDYWWSGHQRMCGGTFIKIKEPEKKVKAITKAVKPIKDVTNIPDIRNYIINASKDARDKRRTLGGMSSGTFSNLIVDKKTSIPNNNNTRQSLGTVNSDSKSAVGISNKTPLPSLPGKKDVPTINSDFKPKFKSFKLPIEISDDDDDEEIFNTRDKVRNIWAKKFITNTNKRPIEIEANDIKPSKIIKLEHIEEVNPKIESNNNLSKIIKLDNNGWLAPKIESNNNSKPDNSMQIESIAGPSSTPIQKPWIAEHSGSLSLFHSLSPEMIKFSNDHLMEIYGKDFTLRSSHFKRSSKDTERWLKGSQIEKMCTSKCPLCNKAYVKSLIDIHIKDCIGCFDLDDDGDNDLQETPTTYIDLTHFGEGSSKPKQEFNGSESMLIDLTEFDRSTDDQKPGTSGTKKEKSPKNVNLSDLWIDDSVLGTTSVKSSSINEWSDDSVLGTTSVKSSSINKWLDDSVLGTTGVKSSSINDWLDDSILESIDEPSLIKGEIVPEDYCECPICNKLISKSEHNEHLEECVSQNFVGENEIFDATSNSKQSQEANDDDDDDMEESNGTKYPCPCCFLLIEEAEMNIHLDSCLL